MKWNKSTRQIKSWTATRWVSVVFVSPDFHSPLIEFKNWLCLFGKGWQGPCCGGIVDVLGSFPLEFNAHTGLGLLLTLRLWWTSKNHKHANTTKHTRNEMWASSVIIQSVSTKNFPASFISSKYVRETHDCGICLTLFRFTAWKGTLNSLISANKSLPVNGHISTRFAHINTNDDTGHTA